MENLVVISAVVAAIAGTISAIIDAWLGAAASSGGRRRILWGLLFGAVVAGATLLLCLLLIVLDVGPFKTRSISITEGTGNVGCRVDLAGKVTVPAGEDALIVLENNGQLWLQGPSGGNPIASGKFRGDWTVPGVIVSDKFYENSEYHVIGLIVSFKDSARLQALPHDKPFSADNLPDKPLASTRETLKLTSTEACE